MSNPIRSGHWMWLSPNEFLEHAAEWLDAFDGCVLKVYEPDEVESDNLGPYIDDGKVVLAVDVYHGVPRSDQNGWSDVPLRATGEMIDQWAAALGMPVDDLPVVLDFEKAKGWSALEDRYIASNATMEKYGYRLDDLRKGRNVVGYRGVSIYWDSWTPKAWWGNLVHGWFARADKDRIPLRRLIDDSDLRPGTPLWNIDHCVGWQGWNRDDSITTSDQLAAFIAAATANRASTWGWVPAERYDDLRAMLGAIAAGRGAGR